MILEGQEIDIKQISFERLEHELIQELQKNGRMVYIHENGVFPSQSPVLFLLMQFQNKKRCLHFMRWNNNLVLVNIQKEFIDQLQETYEIGMESQLMSQVNWRKKLVQTFGEDQSQFQVLYTLEDALIQRQEPTLSFKIKKIKKENQKKVVFVSNRIMETEIPIQQPEKKRQVGIINSPDFKQNLLKSIPISRNLQQADKRLVFQQKQTTSNQIEHIQNKLVEAEKNHQQKNFVNEIAFEQNEREINELKQIIMVKENKIQLLENEQNVNQTQLIQLSDLDKQIIIERKFFFLQDYFSKKKIDIKPCNVQYWRIKISNTPNNNYFTSPIKQFNDIQKDRYDFFVNQNVEYLTNLGYEKNAIFNMASDNEAINAAIVEQLGLIMQGIKVKKITETNQIKPWWSQLEQSLIVLQNFRGICNVYFFNSLPCCDKVIQAFKASLVQNVSKLFTVEQSSLLTHDLYVEFSYANGGNLFAMVNNSPKFLYARLAENGLESFQLLDWDFKQENPIFQEFLYDGFSLCKFCKECSFFSSEPSVSVRDDVLHFLFDSYCSTFQGCREDIPVEL